MTGRRRRNGRCAAPAAATAPALPVELLTRVMDLLSWRETSAMARVCSRWRSAVQTAASARFEWRTTSLLQGDLLDEVPVSMEDAIARLGGGFSSWSDTVFPPSLVLLAARTADPRPFIKGAYWTRAVAAMERARLLPPRCLLVGTLSVCASSSSRGEAGGNEAEEEEEEESMQVTVAHLPGTELSTATFERKELRQSARVGGVCDPFVDASSDPQGVNAGAFLVFSVNPQSARELVTAVSGWAARSTTAIAGGVFPHANCSNPLMLYRTSPVTEADDSASGNSRRQQKSKTKKSAKENDYYRHGRQRQRQVFQPRRQKREPPPSSTAIVETSRAKVQFPSNLVIWLAGGRVRLRAWTASGFAPVTPIVRRCDPPVGATSAQAAIYDQVEIHGGLPTARAHANEVAAASRVVGVAGFRSLRELVRARLDLSTDQALKIIASRDPTALQRFAPSASDSSGPTVDRFDWVGVEMIDCGYSAVDHAIFSLGESRWAHGAFGVVIGRGSDEWRRREVQRVLERARGECEARDELPFGLLVASSLSPPCLSTESNLSSLPLTMTTTELAIGPSDGLDHAPEPTVQQNATSGVLLCYTRER